MQVKRIPLQGWKKAWRLFAEEIDAPFVSGGFWSRGRIVAKAGPWAVTLDAWGPGGSSYFTSMLYTRARAVYVARDRFEFELRGRSVMDRLREAVGMHELQVGYPEFDRRFVTKSNDELKVRALLANARIRYLIEGQRRPYFGVRPLAGGILAPAASLYLGGADDVERLYERLRAKARASTESWAQICDADPIRVLLARTDGLVRDVERLRGLYLLLVETLNQLRNMASASEEQPEHVA